MSKSYTETHCAQGHEWTVETKKQNKKGWVYCVICKRESDRRTREKGDNKEKNNERARLWREQNTERSRFLAKRHYNKIRDVIEEAKNVPCMDCGIRYPHYVMDFDHRNPDEKEINVGVTRSLNKTLKEIEKCDVVCANCHRIRTWKDVTRWVESTELL